MKHRWWMGIVGAIMLATPVHALSFDCATVRAYVAQHGAKVAHNWARAQGYSLFEIALVKAACFKRR